MIHNITDKERDLSKMLQNATQRINDLEAEIFEQARLLGMSGEREAALQAKIAWQEKALKMALETLEELDGIDTETECVTIDVSDVMSAIREALAEQPAQTKDMVFLGGWEAIPKEGGGTFMRPITQDPISKQPAQQQEPVGLIVVKSGCAHFPISMDFRSVPDGEYKLYTSPQASKPWIGLTDEEFQFIYDKGNTPAGMMEMVEARLKEKNEY